MAGRRRRSRLSFTYISGGVIFLTLTAAAAGLLVRRVYYVPDERERAKVGSNWKTNGFSVAIVWPPHTDKSLVEGVTLAAEEVNAGRTPLANKIRLRFYTEVSDSG